MNRATAIEQFRSAAIATEDLSQSAAKDHLFHHKVVEAWSFRYEKTSGGRDAFKTLLADESPHVRTWVAVQLLSEGDLTAIPVLEAIAREGGILGFNAEMTLREWRHWRLGSPFAQTP